MVDELDETPTPDPEGEPSLDAASPDAAAVDDDGMEAQDADDEDSVSDLV